MIRHLLLSSAFLLVSNFIFATTANADEGSANASGPVADMCVFSEPIEGKLAVNDTSNPTVLSSSLAGGTAAQVDITCNGNATLTISKPTKTEGTTEFQPSNLTATAISNVLGLNVSSESSKPGNIIINTENDVATGTIEVNMVANKGSRISPGKYTFTVTLTSTP